MCLELKLSKGIFRTLLVEKGEIPHIEPHIRRLEKECQKAGLPIPCLSKERLLKRWKDQSGRLKISVTLSGIEQELNPYVKPQGPLKMALVLKCTPHFKVKELDFSPRHALQERAKQLGVDEVIEIDERGVILESTYGNLLWKEGRQWCTPDPKKLPIYYGVTVEEFSKEHNVQLVERRWQELVGLELFSCNALRGVIKTQILEVVEEPLHL
jgi:branched-subunit amino acid aminotransferase/4-amino-4-deoxychorismate lyase